MAKAWFESEFGKSKTISPPTTQTTSFAGDSTVGDYYFNQTFQITPTWTQSEISTYLSIYPIVLVPVQPIAFLDLKHQYYTLVVFRDSANQISARLQVYDAKPDYRLTHENFNVNDFSGLFYQICLVGKVKRVFGILNGRFIHEVILKPNDNRGSRVSLRDCNDYNSCVVESIFESLPSNPALLKPDGTGGATIDFGLFFRPFNPSMNPEGIIHNGGGSSGALGNQVGNTLLSEMQLNQMRTLFYANGLHDLYDLLRSTNHTQLSLANNFIKNNNAATIASLQRFTDEGGTFAEFKELYKTLSRFDQINAFFSNAGFTEESKLAVKGFNALMDYDDDFVVANQNRGNKTIKQLVDDSGFPKISAGFLIGLARENGVGNADIMTASFTRIGRIMEDFVMRSLNIPKNTNTRFNDPTGQGRSYVIPDGLGEGNVARYEIDQDGIRRLKSWSSENSIFLDSKFTARGEKLIKDNVSTNANGTVREQLSTMIDVLAQAKGVYVNNVNFPILKASDHGIASLYIITLFDVNVDPNLIQQAYTNNVNVYKRWITYNVNTKEFEVSGGYEDLTPTTVTPPRSITTRKSPGYTDPLLTTRAVYPNWNIQ